jgi:hypothetical protein
MNHFDYVASAIFLAGMSVIAWHLVPPLLHSYRLEQSPSWPTATATIVSGAVGSFNAGRGHIFQGAFLTYRYSVNGTQCEGKFLLSNESGIRVKQVMDELIEKTLDVRYNPRKPSISILNDFHDKRFGSLGASQNPLNLRQAPFDSVEAATNRM